MANTNMTNIPQSVSTKIMIVTDPIDLYYGKNPIECKVNSFLRDVFGDSIESDEVVTISYLLNVVETKMDLTTNNKVWNFLPENIERVKTVLEGVTVEESSLLEKTTYGSILSALLLIVTNVVNKFILGEQH